MDGGGTPPEISEQEGPPAHHCPSGDYRKANRPPLAWGMSKHKPGGMPLCQPGPTLCVSVSLPFIPLMKGKEKTDFPLEKQETRGQHDMLKPQRA